MAEVVSPLSMTADSLLSRRDSEVCEAVFVVVFEEAGWHLFC